jgi:hypothetical protein
MDVESTPARKRGSMSHQDLRRCEGILADGAACPNEATHAARVSTIPGCGHGGYGMLITIYLCQACYDRGSWETVDLSGNPWGVVLREFDGIDGGAPADSTR